MNLDKTFCSGSRCGVREACERWTANLVRWAKKTDFDLRGKKVSIAEFSPMGNNPCESFVEKKPDDND